MKNKRNIILDCLKGFAIFLVIWGHCIQLFSTTDFYNNFVYRIIYSFHMPLFMLISGYLFWNTVNKKDSRTIVIDKFKKILVPSIFFGVLTDIILIIFSNPSFFELIYGLISLWFLNAVFVLSILFTITHKFFSDSLLIYILLLIISYFVPYFGPYFSMYQYFLLGYLINKYNYKVVENKYIVFLSFIIYVISISLFDSNTLVDVSGNYLLNSNYNMFKYCTIRVSSSLSAIYLLYYFFSKITNKRILSCLSYLGEKSIYIYSVSSILLMQIMKNINILVCNCDFWVYNFIYTPLLSIIIIIIIMIIVKYLNHFKIFKSIYGIESK